MEVRKTMKEKRRAPTNQGEPHTRFQFSASEGCVCKRSAKRNKTELEDLEPRAQEQVTEPM